MKPAPCSLVIIASEEERTIAGCLDSAAELADAIGEVILVDAFSRDHTLAVARAALARWSPPAPLRVFLRAYDGQGPQTNFALDQARCPWLLLLDCDERLTPALCREIRAAWSAVAPKTAYYFPRRNQVFGRWLRHGGNYPDYNHARLIRRGAVRFGPQRVHARQQLTGEAGYLRAPLLHQSYADLHSYFQKFNGYTSREAEGMAAAGRRYSCGRMWIESLGHLWRRGVRGAAFLDGAAGMTYLGLGFVYDLARHLKLRELAGPARGARRRVAS